MHFTPGMLRGCVQGRVCAPKRRLHFDESIISIQNSIKMRISTAVQCVCVCLHDFFVNDDLLIVIRTRLWIAVLEQR